MGLLMTSKRPLSKRHERAISYALQQMKASPLSPFVNNVILYGSCARKEQRWRSDVDLCMVLSPSVKELNEFKKAIYILKGSISETNTDSVEVDLKVLIGNEWEKDNTLFYKNIRKDGISIWP